MAVIPQKLLGSTRPGRSNTWSMARKRSKIVLPNSSAKPLSKKALKYTTRLTTMMIPWQHTPFKMELKFLAMTKIIGGTSRYLWRYWKILVSIREGKYNLVFRRSRILPLRREISLCQFLKLMEEPPLSLGSFNSTSRYLDLLQQWPNGLEIPTKLWLNLERRFTIIWERVSL